MRKVLVDPEDFAHELWSAAQLVPGEGISDGVARISALLAQPAEAEGVGHDTVVCWNCKQNVTLEARDDEDGFCPHCMCELDLSDYLINANTALSAVTAERDRLQSQLAEAQANDRTAMGYLHDVRQLVGGSDFPEMVRNVARMADALPGCVELIETLSPFEDDVLRKAYAAMAAKEV